MNLLPSLRYLVALNEHRHFGRAAQACHITQPALSNALRALEQEFEAVIVKRERNYGGFTPDGEIILASAQRMLREHALLQDALKGDALTPHGSLRIGAVPTAVPRLRALPPCCKHGKAASDLLFCRLVQPSWKKASRLCP